ncbi:MAG: GNAT family N-acetyltransferase [Clostridiales bacterium]|nr:MAG: GNAT family N-acetyltransferase [Clostridiales bacterium]
MTIKQIENPIEKAVIAKQILDDLSEWFGIPESTENYIEQSKEIPFLACLANEQPVGFMALKQTSTDTAEIFVIGILKAFHRRGIGSKLYAEFENMAKARGFSYLQVKTVKLGVYDEYDITNNFYKAIDFKALECFPDMWNKPNPCQIYVKYIGLNEAGTEKNFAFS